MYPSLCFVNIDNGIVPDESKDKLQETLSDEEYRVISEVDNPSVSLKFKFIELFNKNKLLTSKKKD